VKEGRERKKTGRLLGVVLSFPLRDRLLSKGKKKKIAHTIVSFGDGGEKGESEVAFDSRARVTPSKLTKASASRKSGKEGKKKIGSACSGGFCVIGRGRGKTQ